MKILLLILPLLLTSCSIRFTGMKSKGRKSTYVKTGKISDLLKNGKVVEYKNFTNWENEFLNDLHFDVLTDSSGSRIGILNEKNTQISKIKKAPYLKIKKDHEQIFSEIDKIFDKHWDKNSQDGEVNAILISLNSDKINRILDEVSQKNTQEISDLQEDEINEEPLDKINYPKISKKILSSNSSVKLELVGFEEILFEKDVGIKDSILSFAKSCDVVVSRPDSEIKTSNISLGRGSDWIDVCEKIKTFKTNGLTNKNAINYFIENFLPVKIYQKSGFFNQKSTGTFTGYYELDLEGRAEKDSKYRYPIYALPPECKNGPCATRGQINNGKLTGRGLELFWSDNPLDIYLLQIQGSGIVMLEDGKYARVGFAGTNKRSGRNVFAYMSKKCIPRCKARLDEIMEWFDKNPEEGNDIIAHTDSYIFFRKLENNSDGAIGAQGISLTPSRSLAVDNRFVPYGTPIWLETNVAIKDPKSELFIKMSRMMVAQDTGEAIKGPIRGDIFFGHGTKARYLAEKQKFSGSYYMIVPKKLVEQNKVKAR